MKASTGTRAGQERRFPFGKNWRRFLKVLDESRIEEARRSLQEMLAVRDLSGRTFLDIGSGSGLFSLAARRLGARVHSLDVDPDSVACTAALRERHFPDDPSWKVEEGSVLNAAYLKGLGTFDVVYAWGVLHHTGDMWRGVENALQGVAPGGLFFVALYNDQGTRSRIWRHVKRSCCSGWAGYAFVLSVFIPLFLIRGFLSDVRRGIDPRRRYREYRRERGMSLWHDWIDWLGGYPYEVATPEAVVAFMTARGFTLVAAKERRRGSGNNEFVFKRP